MKPWLLVLLLVLATTCYITPHVCAQIDPEERRVLFLAGSLPVDKGKGDWGGGGFFYWNRPKWPRDDMQFRLIFAGLFLDAEALWPQALSPNTRFAVGASALGFFDGMTEYQNGDDIDGQRFHGDTASARAWVEHQAFILWDRFPFNIRLKYEVRGSQYRTASSTIPSFGLPPDSYGQSVELAFVLGGMRPGIFSREGAETYVKFSGDWRGNWREWGPAGAPFYTSNRSQKIRAGIGAIAELKRLWPAMEKHYAGLHFTGGYGNRLDRLSCYKLGGSLPTGTGNTIIHGFYARELFASDFFLVNASYQLPLADWNNLAAHFFADYATLKREDIADRSWNNYQGVGTGLSCRVWKTDFLLTYGYGINADRLDSKGGHEIALQIFKSF